MSFLAATGEKQKGDAVTLHTCFQSKEKCTNSSRTVKKCFLWISKDLSLGALQWQPQGREEEVDRAIQK